MNRLSLSFRAYHPIVHILLAGSILLAVANCISILYLPLYLMRVHHIEPVMIGLIVGAGSLAAMFGGFIAGTLSDFIGRRKVMLFALYFDVLLFVGFGLAEDPLILVLLMIANGLCTACYAPVAKALMSDVTSADKRIRVFSLRYVANNIGYAVGPAIGAYISLSGIVNPFFCSAGIVLVYTILLHICLNVFHIRTIASEAAEKHATLQDSLRTISRDTVLLLFIIGGMVSTIVHGKWSVILQQHLETSVVSGELLYGALLSVNSIGVILLQYPLTRFAERHSPLSMVVIGSLLFALGTAGFAFSHGWLSFILFMILFTLGEILMIPNEFILIDRITPDSMRGTYYGAQSFTELGNFLGPVIGGFLLAHYGGTTMFLVLAAIAAASLIFFRWGHSQWLQRKATETNPTPPLPAETLP